MNSSLLDRGMRSSSSIYPEHHAEHTTHLLHQPPLSSHSNRSPISMLLHKTIDSKRTLLCNAFYHTGAPSSTMSDSGLVELQYNLSKGNSMELLSPTDHFLTGASPSDAQDWPLGDCHKAKRARVENIIRGMAGSPGGHFIDERQTAHLQELKSIQENKRKQISQIQDRIDSRGSSISSKSNEGQTLKKRLQTMQKVSGMQVYMTNECEEVSSEMGSTGMLEEDNNTWSKAFPETTMTGVLTNPCSEFDTSLDRTYLGWKKIKLMTYNHSKPENENKLLADILKHELSRAVNTSVDIIFENMAHSLLASQQVQVENEGVKTDNDALYHSTCEPPSSFEVGVTRLHPCSASATGRQLPGVQTEALSLVVKKAALASPGSVNLTEKRQIPPHNQPTAYDYSTDPQGDQLLENLKPNSQVAFGGQCGLPSMGQSALGLVDLPWDPVRVRSKVTSRLVRGHQAHPLAMGHVVPDNLCLPHVKMECGTLQNMVKKHSYVLNEGLTTSHLKKAKLMFFYTRYPSSTVLKTFFPDVQFTRCITSQLIKWFSNFREFYYIQMEKFARHALMEGVTNVRELTVGRHSELFRALNMHYNKANDFQVPERFLEVAGITLQEFYVALSLGKDSDPSWKKAIYKAICKLDSNVPTEFKAPLLT